MYKDHQGFQTEVSSKRMVLARKRTDKPALVLHLYALTIILFLLITTHVASSSPSASPNQQKSAMVEPNQANYDNLVQHIFSDLLATEDERLKKSRLDGMRQVKQTLRFGRRSDPWLMAPTVEEQLALDESLRNRNSIFE